MRLVCEECGKRYDYAVDDFCPRCGAFNQPKKTWTMDAGGNVVRVDGINEANHKGSFVHKEAHKEKFQRRVTGMDRDPFGGVIKKPAAARSSSAREAGRRGSKSSIGILVMVFFALQLLRACMDLF